MDEIVAFATDFGSSTHHTQSPKPRLNPIPTQPNSTFLPPTYITLSNLTTPIQPPSHTSSYSHPHPDIPSTHLSIHLYTHLYTDAYTLTRSIVNKLLTLYISIDILTFMWYNQDNGKGPFYMLNI